MILLNRDLSPMTITYNGYKVKVFNRHGTQVKTIRLNGRDPIVVVNAIRALYNMRSI